MGKIYRLKKDLPTFKAGMTFELKSDGCLYLAQDNGSRHHHGVMAYHRITLELFPELLAEDSEWFEEVKADEHWRPTVGEGYWYIADTDGVRATVWAGHRIDKYRLSIGSVFRTEEDAEKAVKKIEAMAKLNEFGFRFIDWELDMKTVADGKIWFDIGINTEWGAERLLELKTEVKESLDILFGGDDE